MAETYQELNKKGLELMDKFYESLKQEKYEEATRYREEANKYFDEAMQDMNLEMSKMSMLYGEGRNFGVVYDVFEQNMSKMFTNKEDKKIIAEAINLIKNDKILKGQFDVYQAIVNSNGTNHPELYIESVMKVLPPATAKAIKESNERLIETLRKSSNFDELVDIDDNTMKCYESIETMITTPYNAKNLVKITEAKAAIIDYISNIKPEENDVKGVEMLQSVIEKIANRENLPTIDEVKFYNEIIQVEDKRKLFEDTKIQVLEDIEDIINEKPENLSEWTGVYDLVKEEKFNRKNPIVSISKLMEIKETVLDQK